MGLRASQECLMYKLNTRDPHKMTNMLNTCNPTTLWQCKGGGDNTNGKRPHLKQEDGENQREVVLRPPHTQF